MNSPASPPPPNIGSLEMEQMEPANPLRPLLVPAIIVVIGLAIAWALFAHFGRSKPDASGAILHQVVYPVQVNAVDTQQEPGMAGSQPEQNEIIVLVQARVTNISKRPLTIFDIVEDVNFHGTSNQSIGALPEDIDRLFQRFPNLASARTQPLARHQVIPPGKSAEGLMVFNYAWTQQQWDQRKDAHVVISFQDGRPLTLPLH